MMTERFLEIVISVNQRVNDLAWGSVGLLLLLGTGFLCTVVTGFFQVRYIKHWWNKTFRIMYREGRIINDAGSLSQFRAFCTSLCATIGTGNIAGVSTAICLGGPGAVFWMWIAAFLGMMVKYSENVLGIYFRRRNAEGAWSGGPMYYLQDGLGSLKHCKTLGRILGILFCIFTMLASFGIGNMSQINKITLNFESAFFSDVDLGTWLAAPKVTWMMGIFLMIAAMIILMGGFRRLSAVSEFLIPFMTVAYFFGCLIVILFYYENLPAVFSSIFRFAMGPDAVRGGAAGSAVQLAFRTIKNGCKRGVFSNEAGLGSSVMVHSNSCVREPVRQGMWGIAEVFLDTMVICTMTAIVVLNSGAVDLDTGLVAEGTNDATLVAKTFSSVLGKPGEIFVVLSITLFAFTTVLGWSFYGSKVTEYLFGLTFAKLYRIGFLVLIAFGAVMSSNLAWDISDTFNGLMMIPNLIGVITLSPTIVRITKNYIDRRIRGKDVAPLLSFDPDIQMEAERAVQRGLD